MEEEQNISPLEKFYLQYEEPVRSTFQALRIIISGYSDDISEHRKYGLPFFYYKNKPFCYLWMDKKTRHPYIGIVKGILIEHPSLDQGDRKKMKVMSIDPNEDISVEIINEVFDEAVGFY